MIKFKMLEDGAFVCGDSSTRLTSYAYPASEYACKAVKSPERVARQMLDGELYYSRKVQGVKDYDARNWMRLEGITDQDVAETKLRPEDGCR